jgi:phosphatidylinositol glycan class B
MVVNIPVAVWFCLVHQRGTLDAMTYLRSDVDENSSVLFLMPCHSTPFYSHVHRRVAMEFLECPPQLDDSYIDVEKEFYSSPAAWLDRRYSQTHLHPPTHIVMFDTLIKVLGMHAGIYISAVRWHNSSSAKFRILSCS